MELSIIKKAIVTITSTVSKSIYSTSSGIFMATGFIINKQKGWVITNKHLISNVLIQNISVQFFDGSKVNGNLLYSDPEHDFVILTIPVKSAIYDCYALHFNIRGITTNEIIFMLTHHENGQLILQNGTIVDQYIARGHFATQTILTSLHGISGASGSPIFNEEYNVIAMQFAMENDKVLALHGKYLIDALSDLEDGAIPARRSFGVVLDYCKISDLVKFANFPRHSTTASKALCVKAILNIPDIKNPLEVLDVLWSIEGHSININMIELQYFINHSDKILHMSVIRNGVEQGLHISSYNLYQYQITKILCIDNALLYEADEFTHLMTGATLGTVFVPKVAGGSIMQSLSMSGIEKIDIWDINTLKDLMLALPSLIHKQYFTLYSRAYTAKTCFNKEETYSHKIYPHYLSLPESDLDIALLQYNKNIGEWHKILLGHHIFCMEYSTHYEFAQSTHIACRWDEEVQYTIDHWHEDVTLNQKD